MKAWIKTGMKNIGTIEEPENVPDLDGYESKVSYSLMKIIFPNEVLLRIAGSKADVEAAKIAVGVTELTDDEARIEIQAIHSESELENVDIADPEIDTIAKTQGLDPKLRADIQTPTIGKQVLQDQENYLMSHISIKKGMSEDWWDDEAKNSGKWGTGKELEDDVIRGKNEAHELILSRLR